jgi:hypothetical protein
MLIRALCVLANAIGVANLIGDRLNLWIAALRSR